MRLRRGAAVLALVGMAWLAGCSDGDGGGEESGSPATTVVPLAVDDFRAVVVDGSLDVDVTVGPTLTAEVRGTAADVEQVTAEVTGGNLFLRTPDGFRRTGPLEVVLTTPALDQASVGGSGSVAVDGVAADRFVAEIAGTGNLSATGTASSLTAVLGGSGNLALDGLIAADVEVQLIGQGNVGVHADRTLNVNLIGSGNVVYRGDPTVEQVVTGTGTVQKAG
jgi:Putative auto-transporter adhesin, head GIN domain